MHRWLLVVAVGGASLGRPRARADETDAASPALASLPAAAPTAAMAALPTATQSWDFGLLPLVTYAPETSLGAGGGIVVFDNSPAPAAKPRRDDQIALFLGGTLRKQFVANIESLKYWENGRYRLTQDLAATRFPNYFWGVGNATAEAAKDLYTQSLYGSRTSFSVQVLQDLYVGALMTAGWYHTGNVTAGGQAAEYVAVHGAGGWLAGLGAVVRRDTRDDAMGPRTGSLTTATAVFSNSHMAGAYTYQQFELDQRTFIRLAPRTVLAMQAFGRYLPGNVPLDELPALGGGSRLRGYFEGRYRDHLYLMAQVEARFRVWGRFSLAPFVATGNVFPSLSAISVASPKVAGGAGVRFSLKKERDLNIRLDIARSPTSAGVYVNLGEAF